MKTITEFSGFTLKEAISKKTALLAEGKTEDEAQASINEYLKLDESKAPFYKIALDMTGSRIDRVKRVVVALKATESEKVPDAFMEREGHFYLVEFFPQTHTRGPKVEESASYFDDFARGGGGGRGRGGPGGGRGPGGDRGPGGGRGPGGDRGPSNDRGFNNDRGFGGDRPAREPREQRPSSGVRFDGAPHVPMPVNNATADERGPRPPRGNRPSGGAGGDRPARAPRDNQAPRGPRGAGELRLVLKGQTTTLAGSGPAEAPQVAASTPVIESAPTATSTES